jgi:hypothetical protein
MQAAVHLNYKNFAEQSDRMAGSRAVHRRNCIIACSASDYVAFAVLIAYARWLT